MWCVRYGTTLVLDHRWASNDGTRMAEDFRMTCGFYQHFVFEIPDKASASEVCKTELPAMQQHRYGEFSGVGESCVS